MATLEGWLVDNTVTVDDKSDKILEVHSKEGYTNKEIVDLMMKEITGLKRETLNHAVDLYNRIITESLLNGHPVNTGLFYASPSFKGTIENSVWNPEKNSIVINFQTGKNLREEITKTSVEILGEKAAIMQVTDIYDMGSGLEDGTLTRDYTAIFKGKNLKITGDDEQVGIYLVTVLGTEEKIAANRISVNNPSEVHFQVPADLAEGDYTLRFTTQYSGRYQLKEPRSLEIPVKLV